MKWVLIFLAMSLVGCNSNVKLSDAQSDQNNQSLRICLGLDVRSLDPRSSHDHPSNHVVKMLFEGLFRIDLDGQVQPALVESYEISSDKKTYIFKLKSSQWSNGSEVTAQDFEYGWKQVIDPTLPNNGVHIFYPIKNVQAVIQKKATIDQVGIKALDAKTLMVELENPAPFFLESLTFSSFCPVNSAADINDPDWSQKAGEGFICNGPFKLKDWKKGYEIYLEKNPTYWEAQSIKLQEIKIAIVSDLNTQLSMFEKGEIDWLGKPLAKLPLDAIPSLKKDGKLNYFNSLGVFWFFFNTQQFPFNNKNIRKAFSYAINRKEITDYLLQENEGPATSVLPPLLSGKKQHFNDGNVVIARKYLELGMQELGIGIDQIAHITLSYGSSELNNKVSQAIQQQWEKAFGIIVDLQHQEWKSYYDQLSKGDYQIGGMSWYSWTRDPSYTLEIFKYASDGINMSRWENSEYQACLNAAQKEIDDKKRIEFFMKAEELLIEEMPVMPVYFLNITFAKKNNLFNYYVSELNEIDFSRSYFR